MLSIGYGFMMAYLLGWGGSPFWDNIKEPYCYVPISFGVVLFIIGFIGFTTLGKKKKKQH
jgi:hypothetical protein